MNRKSSFIRKQDCEIDLNGTMSEKVQLVANNIYKEFERMISHFGSDVLECLMPLIVGVLENLDELYKTKQNDDLELELIKEDNEALSCQYEKEKTLRKQAEERIFDAEFMYEEEKKCLLERNQEIESLLRISELKLRGSNDMVARLEDKERTLRAENQKLYERYTDIFKSHGDLLQRLKRFNFSTCNTPPPIAKCNKPPEPVNEESIFIASSKTNISSKSAISNSANNDCTYLSPQAGNFKEESVAEIFGDDQWMTDPISDSLFMSPHRQLDPKSFTVCSNIEDDTATADNSLEYNNGDSDNDLTDDEFGIRKEIESLIRENQDLVDTKNALNVVKDDLINRLDALTSESDMLREEIHQHLNRQADLTAKIAFLEQELKRSREEIKVLNEAQISKPVKTEVNIEQKTFSRSDMAVLLQERNHFKERLLELQDALVYTEMMRVKKQFPETVDPSKANKGNNSSVWNLFKNVTKTEGEDVPVAIEEKSKILKNRFRLENNRSQLYSWSIPRALIESRLPKRIPIPIKIHKIFEPKEVVICSTLGFEESQGDRCATYMWCLLQSTNKQLNLVYIAFGSKLPELVNKYTINLQFPTTPFNMCEVPALTVVTKELASIRSSTDDGSEASVVSDSNKSSPQTETKVTKIFHTKVHIRQKSKANIGSKTLWFGCEKNQLVVFVLLDNSKLEGRMATASLPSEIDFIKYHIGRVFVMTKNGSVCMFDLNKEENQWDLHQCLVMDISNGLPISTSCCDKEFLQLWLGSSTNCFIINLSTLAVQKSWTITEDSPSLDQCISIDTIVKIDSLSLMLVAISRVGSLIGYDLASFELKMSIDLRPCVFDLIEPVSGLIKTSLSFYHLVDDGYRLWMTSECGMILVVTLDCLRSHLCRQKSKISLQSDEVLISSHAFAQCVKSICLLTYSTSTLSFGDHECSKVISDQKFPDDSTPFRGNLLMTAIGSCYVNMNNSVPDVLNLSNQALIWKI